MRPRATSCRASALATRQTWHTALEVADELPAFAAPPGELLDPQTLDPQRAAKMPGAPQLLEKLPRRLDAAALKRAIAVVSGCVGFRAGTPSRQAG